MQSKKLVLMDISLDVIIHKKDIKMHFILPFFLIGATMKLGKKQERNGHIKEQTKFGKIF